VKLPHSLSPIPIAKY